MGILEMQPRLRRLHGARLHQQDAGDNLQAVGDAVLQFLEQHPLLPQQLFLLALERALRGDIRDAEQDGPVGAFPVEQLAGIEAHRALAEAGKFMLDLIALHHAVLGNDLFQEHAELRDVPLAVAQRIEQPTLGVLGADLEGQIERAAGGDHAQLLVEDENGLVDRVDNALGERPRIGDGGKLFLDAGMHEASATGLQAAPPRPTFQESDRSQYEPGAAGLFGIDHSRWYVRTVLQGRPGCAPNDASGVEKQLFVAWVGNDRDIVPLLPMDNSPSQALVMVVDDDVLERMGASDMFSHAGYRVIEAGSAAEALRLFETNADVRLLFTDVSMPGSMNGADLACDVARRWPAIGVIVTSGRPRPDKLPASTRFHDKPYEPTAVLRQATTLTIASH